MEKQTLINFDVWIVVIYLTAKYAFFDCYGFFMHLLCFLQTNEHPYMKTYLSIKAEHTSSKESNIPVFTLYRRIDW